MEMGGARGIGGKGTLGAQRGTLTFPAELWVSSGRLAFFGAPFAPIPDTQLKLSRYCMNGPFPRLWPGPREGITYVPEKNGRACETGGVQHH